MELTICQIPNPWFLTEADIAHWFKANGDGQGVVVSSNYKLDPTIVAILGQPVATGGYDNGRLNSLDIGK
ncbi:MAG: hypothetical protein ABFC12_01855 [Methanobacterium sp.]